MRVVDLFSGLGGMTCGALEAGAEVVLAVDSDPVPLKILGANAPHTTTVVATLGDGCDEVSLPSAAPDLQGEGEGEGEGVLRRAVHYCSHQNSSLTEEFEELQADWRSLAWADAAFGAPPAATNLWMGERACRKQGLYPGQRRPSGGSAQAGRSPRHDPALREAFGGQMAAG